VAGPINVEIKPGETRSIAWGLITDKDELNAVNISADGLGAEFLSFPKRVNLVPGETIEVQANISIPFDYPGGVKLNPTMLATEPGERGVTSGGGGIINVQMAKTLSIIIGENPFPEFRELIFKPYIQKAKIANREVSVPVESTSNITGFTFDERERMITFKATGYAGTNGTTIIYPSKLLEAPYFLTLDDKAFTNFTLINSTTGEKGIKITYPHDAMHDNFSIAGARVAMPPTR